MAIGRVRMAGGGAAGSFFYFSGDNKYLVKTISASERRTLRRILRDYVAHFQNNRHSLLSRIYGLYKLKLDDTTSTFVIMGNVFNPAIPIHQRFDLKVPHPCGHGAGVAGPHSRAHAPVHNHGFGTPPQGSTQGRTVGEAHLNEPGVVYKDLDFIKLGALLARCARLAHDACANNPRLCCACVARAGGQDAKSTLASISRPP